jgi:hypothetical protein
MEKVTKDDLKELYGNVFKSENGAKVLKDLAFYCMYDRPMFNSNVDALTLATCEGKRQVYLHILNMLKEL